MLLLVIVTRPHLPDAKRSFCAHWLTCGPFVSALHPRQEAGCGSPIRSRIGSALRLFQHRCPEPGWSRHRACHSRASSSKAHGD